ncbi:serine/threonine-protein kinase [Streptomyces sp. NBC_00158]|uniref:serine/threonine-protein kinase n=1 Tax=Streptomyces sp. NBC_00158 TaxID=2903627 RepID=UPI002F90BA5E
MSTVGSGRVLSARPGDPSRVGPYRIIGRLGTGGMGVVHAGLDPSGVRVAVKVIHAAQAEDPEFRARFRREVALSARVQGPCLIPLLAADPEAASPWLATEYAPGPTLNQHLAGRGPLTGGMLYAFATGTAHALAAIHRAGVVHRDVKPQNVILTPAGPRVLDFGIAHAADGTSVTRTGMMTGTPGWISPEHYRTGSAGPPGDVFAWAALTAYATTGRLPFGNGAPDVLAFRIMSADADLEGIPDALADILKRALVKDPAERITAAGAAELCLPLLASQATQVVRAGHVPMTRIGDLMADNWDMPTSDDPAWSLPARSRKRVTGMVAGAAALIGATTGATLAYLPADAKPTAGTAIPGKTPIASSTGSGSGSGSGEGGSTGGRNTPAAPAGTGGTGDASIQDPSYTGAGSAFTKRENTFGDASMYTATRPASTAAEKKAAEDISTRTAAYFTTKGWTDRGVSVQFSANAQGVVISPAPARKWEYGELQFFQSAAKRATCTVLAGRINGDKSWPYGRYVVTADRNGGNAGDVQGFGDDTSDCAGLEKFGGDIEGFSAATIPSVPGDEIRVADRTAKGIRDSWTKGGGYAVPEDFMTAGFDPVSKTMYIWTHDDTWALKYKESFKSVAGVVACREWKGVNYGEWPYTRYVVATVRGANGGPEFLGSGTCTED